METFFGRVSSPLGVMRIHSVPLRRKLAATFSSFLNARQPWSIEIQFRVCMHILESSNSCSAFFGSSSLERPVFVALYL